MPELAIIADDLTGGLDAAAPFARRGMPTAVALSVESLAEALATGPRVVGISTDSRELPEDAARARVASAVAALPKGTRLFKKIDSRLKGTIAAELDAVPHTRCLVIPAIPAFGRWMRNGTLGGFGVNTPIDIGSRLGSHAAHAVIPDVETQADIKAALDMPHDLAVGAMGLAEAVADAMAPEARQRQTDRAYSAVRVVIGSTDPITVAQVARLRAVNPDMIYIPAPNGVPAVQPPSNSRLAIVQALPGPSPATPQAVATALAVTLTGLALPPGCLVVLSGGATAQAVLERIGVRVLRVVGEAMPGLALASAGDLTFVTKSGGFGDEGTLVRLLAPTHAHEERIA